MKIALWHNLPTGGGLRALVDHANGLQLRGHKLVVYCPYDVLEQQPLFSDGIDLRPVRLRLRTGFRTWSAVPPAPVILDRLHGIGAHLDLVAEALHRERFDVLYAGGCRYLRTTDIGARSRLPSVLYLGEPYRWLYEAMPTLPWTSGLRSPAWWGWHHAMRRQARAEVNAARGFDRILVNSRYSRESVLRAYGIEAQICRLGVDYSRFTPVGSTRDYVIGLGAIVPEKNVLAAVAAVAAVSGPRPRLVWVGNVADRGYRDQVQAAADLARVELDLRVAVDEATLADLLSHAVAMVYAPRLEPFGYAPLEAAASGRPVVGVAEGGVRETVLDGRTGLLVDDESQLGAALQLLLDDRTLADRLGAAGRVEVMAGWSLEQAVDRLEGHLTEVSERRPLS